MFSRGIEQHAGADNVGVNEILRRIDAAIDVRLGREIDDSKKLMLKHKCVHRVGVGDVGFEKFIALAMFFDHALEIGEVAGISERVQICDLVRIVMWENVVSLLATAEDAAVGDVDAYCMSEQRRGR